MLEKTLIFGSQESSCWIGEKGRCRISTILRKLEVDKKMEVWTLAESKRRFLGKELAMVERRRRRWAVQRQVKIICRFIFISSFSPNWTIMTFSFESSGWWKASELPGYWTSKAWGQVCHHHHQCQQVPEPDPLPSNFQYPTKFSFENHQVADNPK